MKENGYNFNDDQFEHVTKLLRDLPKVKATDNFEYNLKVKIENRNFDLNTSERKSFSAWKIFVPATGLVAASVFSFFFFNNSTEIFENPFQIKPKLRTEISSNILSAADFSKNLKINENDVVIATKLKPMVKKQKFKRKIQNKQSIASNINLPFDTSNSTDLDEAISKSNSKRNIDRRASLANAGNQSTRFDGFFLGEEVDKEYVEAMRARMDSLKKNYLLQRQKQRR
jgi:hypothetical protein